LSKNKPNYSPGRPPDKKGSTRISHKKKPTTAFQRLTELVKWVDLIIEVLDGRLPLSTRHPASKDIFGNRPRLIVYSKSDLSDLNKLRAHVKAFNASSVNERAVILNLKGRGSNQAPFFEAALALTRSKREGLEKKGLLPRAMRAIVVGIPNVGKSSLINWFVGAKKAKTGDMPGVTKGTQWIKVHPEIELLDTPGILPPTLFSGEILLRLALLNLLPQDSYDNLEVANQGVLFLQKLYPAALEAYQPGLSETEMPMYYMAEARNYLANHGRVDDLRAANIFLRDLRDGKLGEITLDFIA
jgi:ribosome biogenesis GTPase A